MRRRRRRTYKNFTKVVVKGVPCKIGCRNTRMGDRFATFPLSAEMRKAKAVVLGLRHGPKIRLYVISASELKNLKRFLTPVTSTYTGTSR